jgi:hypothetical protein
MSRKHLARYAGDTELRARLEAGVEVKSAGRPQRSTTVETGRPKVPEALPEVIEALKLVGLPAPDQPPSGPTGGD